MRLGTLKIASFRSCLDTTVELAEHLTLLVGENDAGKSNIIDALRCSTPPASGRSLYFDSERDLSYGASAHADIEIARTYCDLTPGEDALFAPALVDPHRNLVHTAIYRTDPQVPRRQRYSQFVGDNRLADPEPENRERIVHVYLPPLRDAAASLDSADGNKLADIFQLVAAPGEIEAFEVSANESLSKLATDKLAKKAVAGIQAQLTSVTRPVRHHVVDVKHRTQRMRRLVRALRLHMASEGLSPSDLVGSGLGYANLLYIASVVLELERANEFDLMLLLVEEPEAHLHPQLQSVLLSYLLAQAEASLVDRDPDSLEPAGRIQVIASTHSPHLASAVSTSKVVVVTNRNLQGGRDSGTSGSETSDSDADGVVDATDTARSVEPAVSESREPQHTSSQATALAAVKLTASGRRKIDRYLNATRASLLFARQVVLVEGIAEVLLLRAFAEQIVFPASKDADGDDGITNQRLREQFRAITVLPIEGVDFEPYLQLLLPSDELSLVDRVVVVTDGDDGAGSARRESIEATFENHVATGCLSVHVGNTTLEAELYACASNEELLRAAFEAQHPRSLQKWDGLMPGAPASRGDRARHFSDALKDKRLDIGKGDFAHVIAQLVEQLEDPAQFTVPDYLVDAIRAATLQEQNPSTAEDLR